MIYLRLALVFLSLFLITACSTLSLQPADFSWPIETVLPIDDNGMVSEDRYTFSFNTKPLFFEEVQDSMAYRGKDLRMIRSADGFYFITANSFKNVYVFSPGEAALNLENTIFISEFGLVNPVMNQRPPYIELVDGQVTLYLSKDGIERGAK